MRVKWVIGLKGACCVTVVLLHLTASFFQDILMCSDKIMRLGIKNFISLTPLNIFINGSFAVYIFWTLSGFLMAFSWYKKHDTEDIGKKVLNKYFKHIFPFMLCSIIVFLLITGGGYFYETAGEITGNSYLANERDFLSMTTVNLFGDILFGIFFTGNVSLIPPLWTMRIEFFGSIFTALLLILYGDKKYRNRIWLFLCIVLIGIGQVYYICFLIGIKFADHMVNYEIKETKIQGLLIFSLGLFIGGYPPSAVPQSGIYSYIYTAFISGYNNILNANTGTHFLYTAAASCIVYGLYNSKSLIRFFECKALLFLGERSLYIYLVHAPIIFSLTAFSFVKAYNWNHNYLTSVVIACFVTMIATLFFAELVRWVTTLCFEPLSKKIVSSLCISEER